MRRKLRFHAACRIWLRERVEKEKMDTVTDDLWRFACCQDLYMLTMVLEADCRAGDMELELFAKLPELFTPEMVLDILSKKCNPRPRPRSMGAGASAKPKTAKRKASLEAPRTTIQEVLSKEQVEANAAAIRETLAVEGTTLQMQQARAERMSKRPSQEPAPPPQLQCLR